MKQLTILAVLISMTALSGCASKIESSQLDYDNGIAYKHDSTTPFTGIAHFDGKPEVVAQVERLLRDPAPLYSNGNVAWTDHCDIHFTNGVIEGHVACFQRNGDQALSFDIHSGRIDGEAIEYNRDGSKAFDFHWRDGALEGDQTVYAHEGNYAVHSWHVEGGHKRGKEIRRYSDGDDLAEGTWGEDGQFTGILLMPADFKLYTLKDGVKDGPFKTLDTDDPSLKRIAVEGSYRNDQVDGTWTYHGRVAMGAARNQLIAARPSEGFRRLTDIREGETVMVTWKEGTPSGPFTIDDKDHHILLAFNVDDGEITAPIKRFDPSSGKTWAIADASIFAALNQVSNGDHPALRAMNSVPLGPHNGAAIQQAMDAVTQERSAQRARIEFVLDPIHHPDPTATPTAAQPSTSSSLPSAGTNSSLSAPDVPGAQTPIHATTEAPAPAQAGTGMPVPTQIAGKEAHPIPMDPNQGAIDFTSGPFPISNVERNADNLPIYEVECNNDTCVGPTGEAKGSEKEIASQLPFLPKALLNGHGYVCHAVCWDKDRHLIAANPAK